MSARVSRYLAGAGSAALVGLAAATALATAPAAFASTTIQLKDQQSNSSWSAFSHDGCPQEPTSWLWHFVLPGGDATFDSLTVHFQNAGDVVKTSDWIQDGKGAYVTVPGADTILGASAEIEGSTPQGDFVVSHTCAGPTEGGTTGGTTGTTGTTGDTSGTTGSSGTTGTSGGTTGTSGTTGTTGDTTGTTGTTGGGGGGATTTTGGGAGGAVQPPTLGGGGVTVPTAGGGSGLPFTGQNTLQLVGWALGVLAAGLVLLAVGRARRQARR